MNCCSDHKKHNPSHEENDSDLKKNNSVHEGDDQSHGNHGKMMWLMMLACLIPALFIFLFNPTLVKSPIFLILLACVGGHLLMMKFMGHK